MGRTNNARPRIRILLQRIRYRREGRIQICARGRRSLLYASADERLFERVRQAGQSCVQLGAEALYDGDDRDRDAGSNETILDRGRTALVLHEFHNILHLKLHWSTRGCLSVVPGAVIAQLVRNRVGNLTRRSCVEVNVGAESKGFRAEIQSS